MAIVAASVSVAIIGAGPAGCAAASTLGRSSVDVALFERGQPGKDKPCGDGLVPSAVENLQKHGINAQMLSALGGFPFSQIDLHVDHRLRWQVPLGTEPGWVVPRSVLDQAFRDVAAHHATLHYGTSVVDIRLGDDHAFELWVSSDGGSPTRVACDAVIVATGAASLLSATWGISGDPTVGASITAYADQLHVPAPVFQFGPQYRPGYAWSFPVSTGRVNIGVCALAPESTKRLRALMNQYLDAQHVSAVSAWRGGGAPYWSGKGQQWHAPSGIVSCGDAAGLVDPLSGEGITAALVSGQRAAEAIVHFLRSDRHPSHLEEYTGWVKEHFTQRYVRTPLFQVWASLSGIP